MSRHTKAMLAAIWALVAPCAAHADHVNTLQSVSELPTVRAQGTGGSVGLGGKSRGADGQTGQTAAAAGGAGGAGGGAMYQKNETTKELGKAAEKYQQQINQATKDAQTSIKEQTTSFLSSLDKLKVPEVGDSLLKEIGKGTETIAKSGETASKGTQAIVDDIIAATKANADTQVEIVKAIANRLAPNQPAGNAQPKPSGPTIAQELASFQSSRPPFTGNALDVAMGYEPKGKALTTPPPLANGATDRSPTGGKLAASLSPVDPVTGLHGPGATSAFGTQSTATVSSPQARTVGPHARGIRGKGYNVPAAIYQGE